MKRERDEGTKRKNVVSTSGHRNMGTQKHRNTARIAPNNHTAGIKLGVRKATVITHWGEPLNVEQISSHLERLEYDNVNVWIESGKVNQIGVHQCYEGKTQEGLGLGSTRAEVDAVYGALEWDGTWHIYMPPCGIGCDVESDLMGEQDVSALYTFLE